MPWPKKCPKCRSTRISTTKNTFQCNACGYFLDTKEVPKRLEYKRYKQKVK